MAGDDADVVMEALSEELSGSYDIKLVSVNPIGEVIAAHHSLNG